MKTDDLVDVLSRSAPPVDCGAVRRRFGGLLAAAPVASLLLMAAWLGPRPDLAAAATLPMFWVKLAVPCIVAAAGWVLLARLGEPGRRAGSAPAGLAAPVIALWILGAAVLLAAPADARAGLLLGETWRSCPWNIALLSIPAVLLAFRAVRGLAPTRPVAAGAAAGVFAGGVAAAAYALHCPEMAAPFLAVWYVLGMALPAAAGAIAGRYALRW